MKSRSPSARSTIAPRARRAARSRGRLGAAIAIALAWLGTVEIAAEEPHAEEDSAEDSHADEVAVPADFDTRVAIAIERGCAYILPHLARLAEDPPADQGLGHLAITTAAALKAGAAADHPAVVRAFERMGRNELVETYGVSCYLFALDAWKKAHDREASAKEDLQENVQEDPPEEADQGRLERIHRSIGEEIRRASNWLVEARVVGKGYWSYLSQNVTRSGRHDFSNSQFAILGLEIALTHGVELPKDVFREIAFTFLRSRVTANDRRSLTLESAPSLETLLTRPTRRTGVRSGAAGEVGGEVRVYEVPSSAWGYTASDRQTRLSMTAAAGSSLAIARRALEGSDARLVSEIDRALAEAFAHVDRHFDTYLSDGLYTLYSLEKLGDLAEVDRIGTHDWYREAAEKILSEQRANGSWSDRRRTYVDTSLALLFLTRAARLKPATAPRIVTGSGRGASEDVRSDLVYIRRVDGFLSAHEVLRIARTTRDRRLLEVIDEVVEHFPLERRAELVPDLLRLWGGRSDTLGRIALERSREITGLAAGQAEDFERYLRDLAAIEKLERAAAPPAPLDSDLLRAQFDATHAPRLRDRLVDIVHRRQCYELLPTLVDELGRTDPLGHRKITGILELWTGLRAPASSGSTLSRTPRSDGRRQATGATRTQIAAMNEIAEWWKDWLERDGDAFLAGRALGGLIEALDSAGPEEAEELLAAIARIGEPAVPALRDALSAPSCSFYLVEALERVTGREIGLAR